MTDTTDTTETIEQARPSLNFNDTELAFVTKNYERLVLPAGEELFHEGTTGDCAYIVVEGELEVLKASGNRTILLNTVRRGELVGEMALLQNRPRMASVRARIDTELIGVNRDQFDDVLNTCPTVTRGVLDVVLSRERVTEARLQQTQHMANWNALTAGVAHELNNPAGAIRRGVGQLDDALGEFAAAQAALSRLELSLDQQQVIGALLPEIRERATHPNELDALACSAQEMLVEDWLNDRDFEEAWDLAPVLVSLGIDVARLDALAAQFDAVQMQAVIPWIAAATTTYSLLGELAGASDHISEVVGVLKGYSFLDQAPVQTVDIIEGLNNTLLILRGRLQDGIAVQRVYAPDLPKISAFGRELNQVWTNLIDNAITALDGGSGAICVRAGLDPDRENWIRIEIEDSGHGIAPEIGPHIFEPFFTTKKVGQGTGLGLNICYNIVVEKHKGEITYESEPGQTVFRVRLPVDFEAIGS